MAKALLSILLLLSFTNCLFGQMETPLVTGGIFNNRNIAADSLFKKYQLVKIDAQNIYNLTTGNQILFRLSLSPGNLWDIEMERSTVTGKNYQRLLYTDKGIESAPGRPCLFYTGHIKEHPGSKVKMTVNKTWFSGSFSIQDEEYYIEPLARYDKKAAGNIYIFFSYKDVVPVTGLRCSFTEKNNEHISPGNTIGIANRPLQPANAACLKIPVVLMADYQMLQQFDLNIDSLENFLLGNMHLVQGVFSNFNFNPDDPADTGQDHLELEVINCIISTCSNCNIISNITEGTDLLRELISKVKANPSYPFYHITNFWTTRNLYSVSQDISGTSSGLFDRGVNSPPAACEYLGANILKYPSANPALLRLIAAHEMGHNLGCQHDNELNASVTQYIMNSYPANPPGSRFSSLQDFGSGSFSSSLSIKQAVNKVRSCLGNCDDSNYCDSITGVKIDEPIVTADSVVIQWNETTNCRVTLFKQRRDSLVMVQQKNIVGNRAVFYGIDPCTRYRIELQPVCVGIAAPAVTVTFYSTPNNIKKINTVLGGNYYQLQIELEKSVIIENTQLFIDNSVYSFSTGKNLNNIAINSLFADGRKHKIELKNIIGKDSCNLVYRYTAPYGRQQSSTLLLANFNECAIPAGWQDTLVKKNNWTGLQPSAWQFGEFCDPNLYTTVGTIDSSCMMYYNVFTPGSGCCGSLQLTSPPVDLGRYKNTMLSFDYIFYAAKRNMLTSGSGFNISVFNGVEWIKVFERNNDQQLRAPLFLRNVWDTIPPRVFIPVDAYRNNSFRVRLTIDDGVFNDSGMLVTSRFVAAFDNIRIDAYPAETGDSNSDFTVYPNPSTNRLYISLNTALNANVHYHIYDSRGSLVQAGKPERNIISTQKLATGIYFLQLLKNNNRIGKTIKVIINRL